MINHFYLIVTSILESYVLHKSKNLFCKKITILVIIYEWSKIIIERFMDFQTLFLNFLPLTFQNHYIHCL